MNDLLGFTEFTERLNITLINLDKTPENLNANLELVVAQNTFKRSKLCQQGRLKSSMLIKSASVLMEMLIDKFISMVTPVMPKVTSRS